MLITDNFFLKKKKLHKMCETIQYDYFARLEQTSLEFTETLIFVILNHIFLLLFNFINVKMSPSKNSTGVNVQEFFTNFWDKFNKLYDGGSNDFEQKIC